VIVRRLHDIAGTERAVEGPTFVSRRFLLADDRVGFSFHDTILYAGTTTTMWYRHHVEAVYCIEGEGELEDLTDGTVHRIEPGTLYTLNGHERHVLRADTDLRMICVFDPPLTGGELHDDDGAYPLLTPEGAEGDTEVSA
jgi:L-ectoine synthase